MIFEATPIVGAYLVRLEPHVDERGAFARVFCSREFADQRIKFTIAQSNLATTTSVGTVRGLHFQEAPAAEQKFVRCVAGEVFDVIVDMRPDSPSFRNVYHTVLSKLNELALFIPPGVAHGYQAVADHTQFLYMTDEFYSPGNEKGVRFDDPLLSIPWPKRPLNVTDRDKNWPLLQ